MEALSHFRSCKRSKCGSHFEWWGRAVCSCLSHEGHDPDQASIELHWDECQDGASVRQQCGSCNAWTTGCWASTPCRSGCAVGRSSGSKTEVLPCVLNQRAPIVRTWVPRSILWHASESSLTWLDWRIVTIAKQRPARKRFLCLPVAGVAHSLSPLASLITFLSTLLVHWGSKGHPWGTGYILLERSVVPCCGERFSGHVPHCRYRDVARFCCGCPLWSGWEEESEGNVAE